MKKSFVGFIWMLLAVSTLSSCANLVPLQSGAGGSSTAKDIASFYVEGAVGIIDGTDITVAVPFGTNITSLEPTIAITGESVSPASGEAQDFTTPVVYTVTALDNSTKEYTVTVVFAESDGNDIISFSIPSLSADGVITASDIAVSAPSGADLDPLTPTIEISAGATVYPGSGVAQNFRNPVVYIVAAADGSVKMYTVTVTSAPSDIATITAVDAEDNGELYTVSALVGGVGTILDVPKNTSNSEFLYERLAKGESHQTWDSSGIHDLVISGDVLIVTAQDGVTTGTYTITVQAMSPGDVYQGGKIGYIFKSVDPGYVEEETHGIIAANEDGADGAWITGGETQFTLNGNTLTAIGTGQANTTAMMAQTGYTGGAAKICNDYSSGGYSDWYLPSMYEMRKLSINRAVLDELVREFYWTSSEATPTSAFAMPVGTGFIGFDLEKSGEEAVPVRCVRTF